MSAPRPGISIPDDVSEAAVTDSSSPILASLELQEMANLIKSLSSFLAITTSISDPIKQLDKNHRLYNQLSRLDRLATLLLAKDGSDVAAVMYSSSLNSTAVLGIAGQLESSHAHHSPPSIENLFAIKNSNGNDNDTTGRILPPKVITGLNTKKRTGPQTDTDGNTNYLKVVIELGPLSLPEHAQYLEMLFNQHRTTVDIRAKRLIARDLHFCSYFQCRAKIIQRLTIRLHPRCPVRFFDVFAPGAIDENELKDGCSLISQSIKADKGVPASLVDERNLYGMMFAYTKFDFKFDDQNHIILDSGSCMYFHTYIWKLFSSIVGDLEQLRPYANPTMNKAKGYECAETEAFDILNTLWRNFYQLSVLNQTPTFHNHMKNPAILKWFVEQAKASAEGNQLYNKNTRYILEDEGALNSVECISRDTYGTFMKWLKLATQWTRAIPDLATYIISPLSLTILESPRTMQRDQQTPLDKLLLFVLDYTTKDLQAVKRALQKVAEQRSKSRLEEFPGDWRRLTVEEWYNWANNFTGKMHCEAMLACLTRVDPTKANLAQEQMSKKNWTELSMIAGKLRKCEPLIGCSKACCLCCRLYLQHFKKLRYRGSSGRIFPWVIPVWETDRSIYEKILNNLKARAWVSLGELGVLTVDRRHSGSDYEDVLLSLSDCEV